MAMSRGIKIALASLAALVAIIVLALVLLANLDLNRFKPWIGDKVSTAIGRQFAINGDLSLRWERPEHVTGWQRFVPWPHFHAKDITLSNPEWATSGPLMAQIADADFRLNPLGLLHKTISLDSVTFSGSQVNLEQGKGKRNNWTFDRKDKPEKSPWQFAFDGLALEQTAVRYVDPEKKADATAMVDTEKDGSVVWQAKGKFNGEKLTGHGKAGSVLSLREKNVRYPVSAELKVGQTTITADGALTDPANLKEIDVNLKILGASMADLFPLSGVLLPNTPKFSTEGRVIGRLKPRAFELRYEKFKGKVGDSDIGGTLDYKQQDPRPLLSGEVVSNYLNLSDLGALVGGDEREKKNNSAVKQPPDKVLPVSPFKTDRWDKMDVQVSFTGKKIIKDKKYPIDNLQTNVRMKNGVLSLSPLNFGVAGGRLTTELEIDGHADPAKARMQVAARGLKLKELFPGVESMRASLGELNGNAKLTGAGNSIAALLGSSNGELKSLVTEGSISKFILEAAGLNVGSVVVTKLFGDRQVKLNCMAADFDIKDGLMRSQVFLLDTQDATIFVDGGINLRTEEMKLKVNPESKGIRIISLRSPLYVNGTFKKPDVGIDKGVVALKAGAATALGTLAAPLAAVIALINPGPGEEVPCGQLIAQAKQRPVAPAPGK
ncbi:AsmA family protein [Noviherbaspirillum galbum]|uniref:AsmA family protein n=1 Tax=Noviherbaspirillum galbum TaxID=2709383 RepID=A0A6B3SWW7_9BURK|nr:AsmA family protein [Noviherbaspirillum galbum]NEX62249.1 AsmA family protein [Noviherbaspirillum galbum]